MSTKSSGMFSIFITPLLCVHVPYRRSVCRLCQKVFLSLWIINLSKHQSSQEQNMCLRMSHCIVYSKRIIILCARFGNKLVNCLHYLVNRGKELVNCVHCGAPIICFALELIGVQEQMNQLSKCFNDSFIKTCIVIEWISVLNK